MRGSDIVVRALEDAGARWTFGIPGTHNVELYDALDRSSTIAAVLVTDEQSASFMADAVSRTSDTVGVVNVVPGAGVTHSLSGIAEAFMDNVPLVVLACGIRSDSGRAFQLHDIDQLALLRPVTKAVFRPASADEIYGGVRRAFDLARSGTPGPVAVEIPANFYLLTQEVGALSYDASSASPICAAAADVTAAAALLREARHPLLYIGNGAAGVGPLLVELAERLQAPVATTIQGKGAFPETHPLWLWNGLGASAPPFVRRIGEDADVMLAIGCRFSEVGTASWAFTPPPDLVHVDINPDVLNRNFPARLAIVSDATALVRALLASLDSRPPAGLTARIAAGHREVHEEWRRQPSEKVRPSALFAALERAAPDAIYTIDSGNGTFLAMEHLRLDRPRRFIGPIDYSCMGYAVPAAVGAKIANPASDVVAIAGDGALLMTGLELMTAASLGAAPVVCVMRDGELAQIAQFQRSALDRDTCSVLPAYRVDAFAAAVNAEFLRIENEAALHATLSRAFELSRAGRPVMVEVAIDYSQKTFFTRGVIATTLRRLPLGDRVRMLARSAARHASGIARKVLGVLAAVLCAAAVSGGQSTAATMRSSSTALGPGRPDVTSGVAAQQTPAPPPAVDRPPTRADILRGEYGRYRANNDLLFYHLDVRVDPGKRSIAGKNTIRFRMLKDDTRIQLDLYANLAVDKILFGTTPLEYQREINTVLVDFPQKLKAGRVYSIDFYYSGTPQARGRFGGIVFRTDADGRPWINTACEDDGSSVWWPGKDQWRDEPEQMEISVAIPSDLVDVSNGRFVGKTDLGDGYTRWDWLVHYPINSYSVSLNIGNYVHFADRLGELPLDFYVLPGSLEKAKVQFAQAKPMIEAFEKYFGEYPFPKDGYKLIEVPYSGMEHQSAVTYGNRFANGYLERDWTGVGISLKFDFIIIHESGHEWFGNAVSAADVSDMWIHEGWTTYLEALYVEQMFGKADAFKYINAYKSKVRNREPIITQRGIHRSPSQDMYFKGALFLHTLRSVVNDDETWWKLLRGVYDQFKYRNIMTEDLVRFFNTELGRDLTPIFDQYLRRADIPTLELAFNAKEGTVAYRWKADERAFAMAIRVGTPGKWQIIRPTTDWALMPNTLPKDEFQVATDLYYVNVSKHEQ